MRHFRVTAMILGATMLGIAAFATAAGAQTDPPARVGRLAFIDGTVSFHDDEWSQWTQAVVNTPLTTGDSLWTQPGARSEISLAGTRVRMESATQLDVLQFDDRQIRLQVAQASPPLLKDDKTPTPSSKRETRTPTPLQAPTPQPPAARPTESANPPAHVPAAGTAPAPAKPQPQMASPAKPDGTPKPTTQAPTPNAVAPARGAPQTPPPRLPGQMAPDQNPPSHNRNRDNNDRGAALPALPASRPAAGARIEHKPKDE